MKILFNDQPVLQPLADKLLSSVEIFKTTLSDLSESDKIRKQLLTLYPTCQINFDLQDCDRILRMEGQFNNEIVIAILLSQGYQCEMLD
ncbi:MAG: hypothetical protein IPK96_17855 [Flammeovirgaceae bacterium]|jgi:hypothetical protein|nr:hypothetical protein [Flammeovirgaceae bacterium]